METFEIILSIVGVVVLFLAVAGLQRIFSPQTLANGFMDKDKLETINPEQSGRKKTEFFTSKR